jgi:hypothetical protein
MTLRLQRVRALAMLAGLCAVVPVRAATPEEAAVALDENEEANDPVPTTLQLELDVAYTFRNGDRRYVAQLLFQPTMPYDGFFIPGVEVPEMRSVARLQMMSQSQEIGTTTASGLTDFRFSDGVVHKFGPLSLAAGLTTIFPMATNPALGQGKWQLGPVMLAYLELTPHVSLSALVHLLWSVAGDSNQPALAGAIVEPLIEVRLSDRVAIFSNQEMDFYWKGGPSALPVNLGVGHEFADHFVGQMQCAYTLSGQGQGSIQAVVVLIFSRK